MDLSALSIPELRNQHQAITRQLELMKKQSAKNALIAANKAVQDHGFESVHEVLNGAPAKEQKERKAVEPKYRNPDNHEQTWTGRGKKPLWITAKLQSGNSLESFLIA